MVDELLVRRCPKELADEYLVRYCTISQMTAIDRGLQLMAVAQ